MTPGARTAAAIEILDVIATGVAAEQAMTRWARQNRYAGSKDRAAVRDHVFDVMRQRETCAFLGGGSSGRHLVAGLLLAQEDDPDRYFTGTGYAPAILTDAERSHLKTRPSSPDFWNLPEWLKREFQLSLGEDARATAEALCNRAPVSLRVNTARLTRSKAQELLQAEGIRCTENPLCATALTIIEGARKLRNTKSYQEGSVELQDAASQAVIEELPNASKCLDYCAGGGGKSLAMAAQQGREVFAHDINPNRMKDIPSRAKRAGCHIKQLKTSQLVDISPFDLVLCDVPCSGSGSWRRAPEAKWEFTEERLSNLNRMQNEIMKSAARLIKNGGVLVYATCSVLQAENEDRVEMFLREHPDWNCLLQRRINVSPLGDGFYTAHLTTALK